MPPQDSGPASRIGNKASRELLATRLDLLILSCVIAVLVCIAGLSLPLPNVGFAQDLGVFIDAGWRFFQGQNCHADYRSGLGPVFGMLAGIPFRLFGPEYSALKCLPVSVTALFAYWTLALVRKTIPLASALSVSLAIGFYAGGIFHPGFEPQGLTFAAFYNRVGFGLLSVICVAAFLPIPDYNTKRAFFSDISVGVALGLSVFLKVNFFLVGLVAVCAASAVNRFSNKRLALITAAFAGCSVFLLPFIGFRIDRMAEDLALAAALRQTVVAGLTFFPMRNFTQNLDYFIILLFQSLCILPSLNARGLRDSWAILLTLWFPAWLGFGLTLMQSHGNGRCFPTVVAGTAAALPMLHLAYTSGDAAAIRKRIYAAGLVVSSALIIVPHAYAYAFLSRLRPEQFSGTFDSFALRDLKVGPFNNWGEHFTALSNEAMKLVKNHCKRTNSLQYIDLGNLFSFGLGVRSPKGAMLWWDDRATYSAAIHPGVEIFKDTDFILVPLTVALHPQPVWQEIYGQFIEEHFYEVERSRNFKLLAKRGVGS